MRQPWTFIRLLIVSVYGKQHLSVVVFSALIGSSLLEKFPTFRRGKKTGIPGALETSKSGFSPKKSWVKCKECAGALSRWRCQLLVDHNSGLLRCSASRRQQRIIPVVLFGDCLTLWCVLVYNDNRMRALNTISLKCCLTSIDAVDMREKIHTCIWRFKVISCKFDSLKSTRFLQNNVGHFSNRLVYHNSLTKLEDF